MIMLEKLIILRKQLQQQLVKLSKREQIMVGLGVIFIIGMTAYWIFTPISNAYATLDQQLNDSYVRARATSGAIERYIKLKIERTPSKVNIVKLSSKRVPYRTLKI